MNLKPTSRMIDLYRFKQILSSERIALSLSDTSYIKILSFCNLLPHGKFYKRDGSLFYMTFRYVIKLRTECPTPVDIDEKRDELNEPVRIDVIKSQPHVMYYIL